MLGQGGARTVALSVLVGEIGELGGWAESSWLYGGSATVLLQADEGSECVPVVAQTELFVREARWQSHFLGWSLPSSRCPI